MIKEFKQGEVRDSGIIYRGTFTQIKRLFEKDPVKAGELAIAAIELVLTGDYSSDDLTVEIALDNMKDINAKNVEKYNRRIEEQKQKKIEDLQLDLIAEMYLQGYKQREISEQLGVSQQTISKRLALIKKDYVFLLEEEEYN